MATDGERDGLSFGNDVKPLFRERDRGAMLNIAGFDLWQRDDVAHNADAILKRLEDGSMPATKHGHPTELEYFVAGSVPECHRNPLHEIDRLRAIECVSVVHDAAVCLKQI